MPALRRLTGLGAKSHFEYRRIGKIFQRPDHCRIREGYLEREAVSGGMKRAKSVDESAFRRSALRAMSVTELR